MVIMTNEERINKLCEYIIDLIDVIQDKDTNLDWVKDEVWDIWNKD